MQWLTTIDIWSLAIIFYIFFAIVSLFPTIQAMRRKIKLHPGGSSFSQANYFSEEEKKNLDDHFSRIQGTLVFWKNVAEKYRCFHYYCLFWTIPISLLIPIITQTITDENSSRLFLTIISTHAAILLSFHKGFKVENNFKAFRHGESEFYDLYRRFLDSPTKFGKNKQDQIQSYFEQVEQVRKYVRNAETDNFPTLEEAIPHEKKP